MYRSEFMREFVGCLSYYFSHFSKSVIENLIIKNIFVSMTRLRLLKVLCHFKHVLYSTFISN